MKAQDKAEYIQRYEARLQQFGYSPETLGWGKHGRQDVRFGVLAEYALRDRESSVLDVGCGFADLYDFLRHRGWAGRYVGMDVVPGLLSVARERHPTLELQMADITEAEGLGSFDYVISSGTFNAQLVAQDNREHIERALRAMFFAATQAVCADFLSTYVDFQKPGAWHSDPAWIFSFAKTLSRRVTLRHDYMPFEFSVFIFRDDEVTEQRIFRPVQRGGVE